MSGALAKFEGHAYAPGYSPDGLDAFAASLADSALMPMAAGALLAIVLANFLLRARPVSSSRGPSKGWLHRASPRGGIVTSASRSEDFRRLRLERAGGLRSG